MPKLLLLLSPKKQCLLQKQSLSYKFPEHIKSLSSVKACELAFSDAAFTYIKSFSVSKERESTDFIFIQDFFLSLP